MQLAIHRQPNQLDRRIRIRLAESLEYIFDQCGDLVEVPVEQRSRLKALITANRIHPGLFARYYDLVFMIKANDFDQAQRLVDEIISLSKQDTGFEIIPYSQEALSEDFERFPRLAFSAFSESNPMACPDMSLFEKQKANLAKARKIVSTHDPAVGKEIDELVSRIIICVNNDKSDKVRVFAGVSSLMIWGAIIVNAHQYRTLYQLVEFLIHETTHCVLFGLSVDAPLVLNAVDERYPSPLRSDPRPMDGIYHATLVCARIALFMQKWQDSATHSRTQSQWLQAQVSDNIRAFRDGHETINQYAKLSNQGSQILERFACLIDKPKA